MVSFGFAVIRLGNRLLPPLFGRVVINLVCEPSFGKAEDWRKLRITRGKQGHRALGFGGPGSCVARCSQIKIS